MMPRLNNSILVIVICVAVVAVIIGGFMLAGSPQLAREQQIDMVRSSNLQNISYSIDLYYQRQQKLPQDLSELYSDPTTNKGNTAGFMDPETLQPYEYSVKGTEYELCAVFTTLSDKASYEYYAPEPSIGANFYRHDIGRTCYTIPAPVSPIPVINVPAVR